jgi:hypothetical protein
MENFMPEEIQKKVKSIEKELNENSYSDNKLTLWFSERSFYRPCSYFLVFILQKERVLPLVIFVLAFSLVVMPSPRFSEHKKISIY